jgi:hypothetical protein
MNVLQHVRRRDVGHVEGRVLAHQHHVDAGKVDRLKPAQRGVIAALATHLQRPRLGAHHPVPKRQMLRQIVQQGVAARLRLKRQGEGRVGVDIHRFDRIHLDGNGQAHRDLLSSGEAAAWPARRPQLGAP